MRESKTDYMFFCDHLLGAVTGMKRFAKDSRSRHISQIATVSDEAFALVLLENNFNVWSDMYSTGVTKGSTINPEYTNGGNSISNGRSRKYKGWSDAGIDKYNDLFDKVKQDRKQHLNFDKLYLDKKKEEWKLAGEGKRKRYRPDEDTIIPSKARHELWDEVMEREEVSDKEAESENSDSDSSNSDDNDEGAATGGEKPSTAGRTRESDDESSRSPNKAKERSKRRGRSQRTAV